MSYKTNSLLWPIAEGLALFICDDTCSDIVISVDGKTIPGHKFILRARTDKWGLDLDSVSTLELPSGRYSVSRFTMTQLVSTSAYL